MGLELNVGHRHALVSLGLLGLLGLSACGSAGDGESSQADAPLHGTVTESARIQTYIDAQYARSDVKYAFRTRFGEDIDCVDQYAQPALKDPDLAGQPLSTLPAVLPGYTPNPADVPSSFDGSIDENGNQRRCLPGTVPLVRLSAASIAKAGGLAAWQGLRHKKGLPPHGAGADPAAPPAESTAPYYYALGLHPTTGLTRAEGARAKVSIYAPTTQADADHSISQIWLQSSATGIWATDPNCTTGHTSNCTQTLELGWNVDTSLYHDGGEDGDGNTHLFFYSTQDGYRATGCYNGCGFVAAAGAAFTPGQALSFGPGSELGLDFENAGGDWGIYVNGLLIGSFPKSRFSNGLGGTQPLTRYLTYFKAGGEVYDPSPTPFTWMGQFQYASAGYSGTTFNGAAYQRSLQYTVDLNPGTGLHDATLTPYAPNSAWYSESSAPAPGGSGWGTYFFFGGPG